MLNRSALLWAGWREEGREGGHEGVAAQAALQGLAGDDPAVDMLEQWWVLAAQSCYSPGGKLLGACVSLASGCGTAF